MKKQVVFLNLILLIAIVAVSFFLFFWQLGSTHLTNWDEAWYADISRTMAEKGNIFSPAWNGRVFLEKPPLSYWLTALSYRVFGDSEFSARFVSALSAAATVLLVFEFVIRRWGTYPALASSLLLLSTPAYLWRARTGDLDSLLTLFLTTSAVLLIEVENNKKFLPFGGFIIGLAFLTKGSIAFIFPILSIMYYFVRDKKKECISILYMVLLGAFLATAWISTMYALNGRIFLIQFFTQQVEKVGSPFSFIKNVSFSMLDYLKSGLKYWIIIVVPACMAMLWQWRKSTESFVVVCALVFFVVLSFLKVQSSWFLMPTYPLFAIIVGWSVYFYARTYVKIIAFVFIVIALFQLWRFRSDYFVPDVSRDEALVAQESARYTKSDDVMYLTHYYYPTAVYYSRRITYAVYSDHPSSSWWILSKDMWPDILHKDRVFINTNAEDLRSLRDQFPMVRFEILFQSGDKLLVHKIN